MSKSTRVAGVAAAALLSLTIAVDANAATARIGPVVTVDARTSGANITLVAHSGDHCRMLIDSAVLGAYPGAPALPLWRYPTQPAGACQDGYEFEDGSALAYGNVRFPRAIIRPGRKYFLAVRVWSKPRQSGTRYVSHTYYRSFWGAR